MDSQGSQTRLLPYEAIDAGLLDAVAIQQDKDDRETTGHPPAYWHVVAEETRKAEVFNQVFEQSFKQVEERGVDEALAGVCLKLLLMGWRMAEIYLNQQIEKSTEA